MESIRKIMMTALSLPDSKVEVYAGAEQLATFGCLNPRYRMHPQ